MHNSVVKLTFSVFDQNFRNCKWLLCGLYHPPYQKDQYFFDDIDKALDVYSS